MKRTQIHEAGNPYWGIASANFKEKHQTVEEWVHANVPKSYWEKALKWIEKHFIVEPTDNIDWLDKEQMEELKDDIMFFTSENFNRGQKMKLYRLYKESGEMKSVTVKVTDEDYPYPHQFNVGDDVFVLAPADGSDFDENYHGDFVHLLGKLLRIYETKSHNGKFMGDVKVYEYNKVYDGEIGTDIVPDFIYDKPQKFIVRFKYSHRTDDEQEFTARSKEEAEQKFSEWASKAECSEDFDFQFIDAEEEA